MKELIIQNLIYVGIAMGLLALAWLANFLVSIINVRISKEMFDPDRFKTGMLKLLALILATALLAILVTLIPIAAVYFGVPIPDDYINFFNITVIVVLFMTKTYFYIKQVYTKLNEVINKDTSVITATDNS